MSEQGTQTEKLQQFQEALAYGLHLKHPDQYDIAKIPSLYPLKSHPLSSFETRLLKADSDGNLAIYFNPLCQTWAPIFNNSQSYSTVDNSLGTDSEIYYADHQNATYTSKVMGSTTAASYYAAGNYFNGVGQWGHRLTSVPGLNHAKKVKLIAAQLKLIDIGRLDNQQGTVQGMLGLKPVTGGLHYEQVSLSTMDEFPHFSIGRSSEGFYCQYRPMDEEFVTHWGPYSPYKSIPYFIIYGAGLTPNHPFQVEIRLSFEMIVDASVQALVSPRKSIAIDPEILKKVQNIMNLAPPLGDIPKLVTEQLKTPENVEKLVTFIKDLITG